MSSAQEHPEGASRNVSLTNTATVQYSADNRNTRSGSVQSLTDDNWGLFHNRMNLQLTNEHWQASARVDTLWFYTAPSARGVGLDLLERRRGNLAQPFSPADSQYFALKEAEARRDLSTRYRSTVYPTKYSLTYRAKQVEGTLGDFSAQLGRGFVLSVREQDEIASNTTVRGARIVGTLRARDVRLKATALGGVLNPLRIDDATGRYLSVDSSVRSGALGVLDLGMPTTAMALGSPPSPSLAPDRIVAGQLELGIEATTIGLQTSRLMRQASLAADTVRAAPAIQTSSLSVDLPTLWPGGSVYAEGAMQQRAAGDNLQPAGGGYALYTAITALQGAWIVMLEGKHYRRFFPLLANVDMAQASEFAAVQYNAPPTTEAAWVDTEFGSHNTCVSGGRVKLERVFTPRHTAGVWLGHYRSWAESVSNDGCSTNPSNLNVTWDLASTFEQRGTGGGYRDSTVLGARLNQTERALPDPAGGQTHLYYGELYARYDLTHRITADISLELRGWHRRRLEPQGGPKGGYYQGDHSTGVRFDALLLAMGTDYDTDPRTAKFYLNGVAQYDFSRGTSLALFAGQRRGGLTCVNGVCRTYAPFEGVRVDFTLRL
ncbi:MAG TPA: hypothetical protein VL137_14405 [Polyangiaceae bacterium]|nr:hypothetical protein [Polyangiaceae bacterium]